ncbi:MAG TPA: AraC family transcriptional regulator [Gemmatimonadales bacterium]|jgi:AraC family transcriptional regulator|nr:AraC family transcriptional regulator [Gemmatimonadales bacterium]
MNGTHETRRVPEPLALPEVRPVPANPGDLVRALRAGDLVFSESRHRAPIAVHIHEQATLTILLEGTFEESYPGRIPQQRCLASSVLFRPPGEPHADRFGREGALNLVVEITPARLETLIGRTDMFARITERRDATVQLIARKMHHELGLADSATPLALEGLTFELLAHVGRATGGPGRLSPTAAPWLGRARELLQERFRCRDLRIVDLAGELDVHPVYLSRAFRAWLGSTPGEYLRQLRLAWSVTALTEGGRSIAEIAVEAGFADQSHFTRAFRRAFGETPGGFRRSVGMPGEPRNVRARRCREAAQ